MSESVSGRQHLDDVGFDELRALASAAGDKMSLAMAMAGQVGALIVHARFAEASSLASEYVDLVESIGDPTLIVALLYAAVSARSVTGEMTEAIRLSQADSAAPAGDSRDSGNRRKVRRRLHAGRRKIQPRPHTGYARRSCTRRGFSRVWCARGDEVGYRNFADRYLEMAERLDFEPHIAAAKAM